MRQWHGRSFWSEPGRGASCSKATRPGATGSCAGRSAKGWPVYHAVHDPGSGSIYAAAASEWHGSAVWRSPDLGETWEHSSEGLAYEAEGEKKMSKVSNLAVKNGRILVGVEMPGIFESKDGGKTFSLLTTLAGQPGSEGWDDPANQPPGHLGISAIMFDPEEESRFWAIVQGVGLFETQDDAKTWAPRNKGLRADWPREHEEVGFCVHKLVRSPVDGDRMYQQNHVGMHRSDDCGHTWTEITEGLPTEFGFAAATHPHDRETFYVIPLDPGHGRTMPEGMRRYGGHGTQARAGNASTRDCPPQDAWVGVLREGMAIDMYDVAGALLRHEHGPGLRQRGRGRELERDRRLPAGDLLGRGGDRRVAMAEIYLPSTLPPLFPGLPRRLELEAATVDDVVAQLDASWPGLRDRLCEPGPAIRPHIHFYVDRERAALDTRARASLPGRRDRGHQRRLRRAPLAARRIAGPGRVGLLSC